MALLIGADPEIFIRKGNEFISAHGFIPGNKEAPFPVNGGAVQVDGMALEFNIAPQENVNGFVFAINDVLGQLRAMIPPEFDLALTPVAHFTPEHMEAQPEDAKRLGCDPDFCGWTREENPKPDQHPIMRTASGHIHLGWADEPQDPTDRHHFLRCCATAKQLDYALGIPSLLLDDDDQRRQMYGKAGCFRPKPYGMEYRTLSNFWLTDPRFTAWAFTAAEHAFYAMEQENFYANRFGNIAQLIIDGNDKVAAERFTDEMAVEWNAALSCLKR